MIEATAFSPAEVNSLVEQVYDDLVDGGPFQRSVDLLRGKLAAAFAVLSVDPPHGEPLVILSGDAEGCDVVPSIADAPLFLTGRRDGAPSRDWHNWCHVVEADTGGDAEVQCHLRVFRPRRDRPFGDGDRAICRLLVSHIRRAVGLHSRLERTETERCIYSSVMDRLLVGTVLLDTKGLVVHTTSIAAAVLADRSGLQIVGGRLRATTTSDDRELQAIIKEALCENAKGLAALPRALSLTRPSGARNLGLIVQPIHPAEVSWGMPRSTLAVFVRDPERNADVENDVLRQLFDLTPAEATIARRLTAGLSLEEVAASLEISRNTARAHLRSIFSKSGITRQTELVRLILNSAAVLGQPSALAVQ